MGAVTARPGAAPAWAGSRAAPVGRRGLLRPGWPLAALLGLYPIWWFLGLGAFAFLVFAVPMALYLIRHRPVKTPPGFGLWLLFLLWVAASYAMFPFSPPNTIPGALGGRVIGISFNAASYLAATIALLYVVNLPKTDMPQRRLLALLSVLFVVTVAGGLLGVVAPHFQMTAPLERVLPGSVRTNAYTRALIHPQAAQIQNVLGAERPRPAAPFGYANFWGNIFSILLVWWVVFMWCYGSRRRRVIGAAVGVVAVVPVVYSLNRALWGGLLLSTLFVVARTVQRRGLGAAFAIVSVLAVAATLFVLSPFRGVVVHRTLHGESNAVRHYLSAAAVHGAEHSPILGYGGTRKTLGSNQSIAVGPSDHCPRCGDLGIGSNGQFWLVLFAQGFVGAAFYLGFFGWIVLAYWRDTSTVGTAGVLVVLLSFLYMFFYNVLPSTLALTMISIGVLVREGVQHARRSRRAVELDAAGGAALSPGG